MMDPSGAYVGISSFEALREGCQWGTKRGIIGSRRAEGGGGLVVVRDASYDILPPEVPGSASGSVPAEYCPAA